jgi:hypothetical protein
VVVVAAVPALSLHLEVRDRRIVLLRDRERRRTRGVAQIIIVGSNMRRRWRAVDCLVKTAKRSTWYMGLSHICQSGALPRM